jgi:starch synthase
LERRCYVLTLGSGEQVFKEGLMQIRNKYPSRIRLDFTYNEPLAHRIFAGADMFLMPSRFEPCGLTQMIAMHYGTIPIVHDVGGLKNTVKDFDPTTEEGSGFKFLGLNKENILSTLDRALIAFSRKELWRKIRYNAVKENFSWESSATKYIDLYREIICQPKS